MRRAEQLAEALAYVDGCLASSAVADFERRLEADPVLKGEIELWRLTPDGRDTGHIRSSPPPPQPPNELPPKRRATLPAKPIPPLNDPAGWLTQRVPMGQEQLVVGGHR